MRNILIVVDVQKGFVQSENTIKTAEEIVKLTTSGIFDYVIATKFINLKESQFTTHLNWHQLFASPDTDLFPGIHTDKVVKKNIYTCVNKQFIRLLKTANKGKIPSKVYICGIDTDCCVLTIATDLFENNIIPLVLVDYCNSNGGETYHQAGLRAMERLIGFKSLIRRKITSKDILRE